MIFTCPHCRKQHRLPDDIAIPPNSAAHCKKCGRRFLLEGGGDQGLTPTPENTGSEAATSPVDQQSENASISAILAVFPELLELPPGKFSLAEIYLSATGGGYRTSRNRHLSKLIRATSSLLNEKVLRTDERVCRIASGIAYFPFEIPYANGLLTWPLNYYALLATNHRLLFVNLDFHLSQPGHYIFQVPYGDISLVSRGFYGSSLIVTTHAGRTWDFTTVKRGLASGLEKFIRLQLGHLTDSGSDANTSEQLCPACYQPVPKKTVSCPHCLAAYKSPRIALKKSLFLPGAGNIYLGNRYLGILEAVGYLFTWMMAIFLTIVGIPGGILGGGAIIVAYHLMAAFMAGKMAAKGYLVEKPAEEISSDLQGKTA
jgi:hypothetical protein